MADADFTETTEAPTVVEPETRDQSEAIAAEIRRRGIRALRDAGFIAFLGKTPADIMNEALLNENRLLMEKLKTANLQLKQAADRLERLQDIEDVAVTLAQTIADLAEVDGSPHECEIDVIDQCEWSLDNDSTIDEPERATRLEAVKLFIAGMFEEPELTQ